MDLNKFFSNFTIRTFSINYMLYSFRETFLVMRNENWIILSKRSKVIILYVSITVCEKKSEWLPLWRIKCLPNLFVRSRCKTQSKTHVSTVVFTDVTCGITSHLWFAVWHRLTLALVTGAFLDLGSDWILGSVQHTSVTLFWKSYADVRVEFCCRR